MLSGSLSDVLVGTGVQSGTAIGGALAAHAIGTATIGATIAGGLASAGIALAGVAIMGFLAARKDNAMDKVNSTKVADEAERLLKQNLDAWNESNKTVEDKELAMHNATAIMDWMRGPSGCGNPALEGPGERCISERLVPGARYPWSTWYVDPIESYTPTMSVAQTYGQSPTSQPGSTYPGTPGTAPQYLWTTGGGDQTAGGTDGNGNGIPGVGIGGVPVWVLALGAGVAVMMMSKRRAA